MHKKIVSMVPVYLGKVY